MPNVRVELIWDGDPEAPDSTARVDAVHITFIEGTDESLPLSISPATARQLWGRLGDALRHADGEGGSAAQDEGEE